MFTRARFRQATSWSWCTFALSLIVATVPLAAASDESAASFVERAEQELAAANEANQRAQWVYQTYLTDDTSWLAARANQSFTALSMRLAVQSAAFDRATTDPVTARKLKLLATLVRSPAPVDVAAARQWADLQSGLASRYNRHSVQDGARKLGSYGEVRHAMEVTDDPATLVRLWRDWHAVGRDLQPDYAQFVALSRQGAKVLGFSDVGELWRSVYDMPPAELEADAERLWSEIKPLYAQLHCYVRGKLSAAYGPQVQPKTGPIRIELTRNQMGMYWVGAYDLVARDLPASSYDLDAILQAKKPSGREMAEYADRFWSSMGLQPMPPSFWKYSVFDKPLDHDMFCPGSAALIDGRNDVRMKACANPNALDFSMLHHELGHDYYGRAYNQQPHLFQASANDAFHEAVADLGAVSITPGYLQAIGLITADQAPGPDQDLGLLMRMALQRVSFMPFALIVDKWRWQVFSGAVGPDQYDAAWWDLVRRYQRLAPSETRPEGSFDVASLPHVTANITYIQYFYAYLLEFQMLKAACDRAGWTGPLHRCSLYGDKANGARLQAMMELGSSKPWQEALEQYVGDRRVSAQGMLSYFRPLEKYLERANRAHQCNR